MAPLGPFESRPRLAVAVSGGADSLALALLADAWARPRGGEACGLIVDHGLRPASAAEAAQTLVRLTARGIAAAVLPLHGLQRGPALAARARAARYRALTEACAADGRVHLFLGHHAADQAETVAMRMLAGSGAHGLAAMPAVSETPLVRLLRPLLPVPPARLRDTLRAAGAEWVEDPSNADPAAQRARLRLARRDRDGDGPATLAAVAGAAARARARAGDEWRQADVLAARAHISSAGYALLSSGRIDPAALAALLQTIAGADWPPSRQQVAALAAAPHAATLGGARLLAGGRWHQGGWIVAREAAAMQGPLPAAIGAVWDGRFRLIAAGDDRDGVEIAALGEAAARLRRLSPWPAAVLRTLPAIWRHGALAAVPHLRYSAGSAGEGFRFRFVPAAAATDAPFAAIVPSDVAGWGCTAGADTLC